MRYSKQDVSFHRIGYGGPGLPAVNVKVHGSLECCSCSLVAKPGSFYARTTKRMVEHLAAHRDAGHTVPEDTLAELRRDAAENDAWMAAGSWHEGEPMTSFLDPNGIHLGDSLGPETVIAYGYYTDDQQAVITLMPRHMQAPSPDRPVSDYDFPSVDADGFPTNYCTFFVDKHGNRTHVRWHTNIVYAVARYAEEMGMDV